jgi:hypothetical protein
MKEILENLVKDYGKRGITLVVGSGVSRDSDIPTWVRLLERIAADPVVSGTCKTDVGQLMQSGLSLPAIAAYLQQCHGGTYKEFIECVRYNLYSSFKLRLGERYKPSEAIALLSKNRSLRSIAATCVVRNPSPYTEAGQFTANPRIHDVITFNLDALLETLLKHKYSRDRGKRDGVYRTIEKPAASSRHGRVNIYHVHGFLRFDRHKEKPARESTGMVFTEQKYFDFFNSATSLFTYTFLSRLRENPCLFIGLSMVDDNLRRLLHYSKLERKQSYLEEGETEDDAEKRSTRHYALLPMDPNRRSCNQAMETTLAALGTRVIWIEELTEIETILCNLYESADGNLWTDVFKDIPSAR